MNDAHNENPYQSSLGSQIMQRAIHGIARVLLQQNSVARQVLATGADLTTGTENLQVSLHLPKVIQFTYVQSKTNWLNTLPPQTLRAQILEYIRDAVGDVLDRASIKAQVVFVRYRDESGVAEFEVVLEDLAIVEEKYLPRVLKIAYV